MWLHNYTEKFTTSLSCLGKMTSSKKSPVSLLKTLVILLSEPGVYFNLATMHCTKMYVFVLPSAAFYFRTLRFHESCGLWTDVSWAGARQIARGGESADVRSWRGRWFIRVPQDTSRSSAQPLSVCVYIFPNNHSIISKSLEQQSAVTAGAEEMWKE